MKKNITKAIITGKMNYHLNKDKKTDVETKNDIAIKILTAIENGRISDTTKLEHLINIAKKQVKLDRYKKDKNRIKLMSYEAELSNNLDFESDYKVDMSNVSSDTYDKHSLKLAKLEMLKILKKGKERAIYTMAYIKGYNQSDIAKKLKLSNVAIFKRLLKIEKKIGESYDLNAFRNIVTNINQTTPIDKTGYGVNTQKTSVKQTYNTQPGEIMTYSDFEKSEYVPMQDRDDNQLKSQIKQAIGNVSAPKAYDSKDIGVCLKRDNKNH